MKKIKIFCTLGPKSLNKSFLRFVNKKVSLVRLNLSHINISELAKTIQYVKKHTKVPICIDTEGAQIRTKVKKKKIYHLNQKGYLHKFANNFYLYPENVFDQIKKGDILNVGFDGLIIKIIKNYKKKILFNTISKGLLDNNKGVHISNRSIKLDFLTIKDYQSIELSKRMGIKNFALSFTNSLNDIRKFKKILPKENKIYKLETKKAINSLEKLLKHGTNFLIDRGDLSKEVSIYDIPFIQRKILKASSKKHQIYVATNFLESMIKNPFPNRGEVNDIYNVCELGASGLVLAAETSIGNYPQECVDFLVKFLAKIKGRLHT